MEATKLFRSADWVLFLCLFFSTSALKGHGVDDPYLQQLEVADLPKAMFDAVNTYGRHMGDLRDDELRWAMLDALVALELNEAMRGFGCDRLMINCYIVFKERGIYNQFWELMSELLVREDIMPEVLHPAIYFITGETYYGNGYYHSAIDNLTQYVEAASVTQHESNLYCNALTMISLAHKKLGDLDKAFFYAQRNSEQHSVSQLLKEIRELLDKSARNKNIELHILSDSPALSFYADITHIKLVLSNILSNAIKFSPKDSAIYVKATSIEGSFICLEVADQGPGISAERLQELQSDQPVRSERGSNGEMGTGLGLAISRQFIAANRGKMKISSVLGEGTQVAIWIPTIEPTA